MKSISGWGHYPEIKAEIFVARDAMGQAVCLSSGFEGIARGMGRSYGDSSLSARSVDMLSLDNFLSFDSQTGVLKVQSGVILGQIIDMFLPKRWFLPVTPGTRYVSVGGAVASDVHGKNHHLNGSFCDHVLSIRLMLANGDCVECSRNVNSELFRATCGGMGLTGLIQDVTFQLQKISSSYINQTTFRAENLKAAMDLFEEYKSSRYSVGWIDCLARGGAMGRALVMLGDHCGDYEQYVRKKTAWSIPVNAPAFIMNSDIIRMFNRLYYHRPVKHIDKVDCNRYFFPLDGLRHWNRLYGKKGFVQYQFVIPEQNAYEGMKVVLDKISRSGRGSFLAVIKKLGVENNNFLSFPLSGFTLALDFRIDAGLMAFLDDLDRVVLEYGGRIYLTKDARMSSSVFRDSYSQWEQFQAVRERYGALGVFRSMQSDRLGL